MKIPAAIKLDDASADSGALRLLGPLRKMVRQLALKRRSERERRILTVAERIYPMLQFIESIAYKPEIQLLTAPFAEACKSADAVERGAKLMRVALAAGLVKIAGLKPDDRTKTVPACGVSLNEAESFFVQNSVESLFRKNTKALEVLRPLLPEGPSVARLRILATMDALALTEMEAGFGKAAYKDFVLKKEIDYLAAWANVRAFQVRALRQVMGHLREVLDWPAGMVAALVSEFQCVEQFRDMGESFLDLKDEAAIRAIGRWEKRDITDRVNEERKKKGEKALKGRRFETDIGQLNKILGAEFATLIQRGPDVIEAFGEILRDIRGLQGLEKTQSVDDLQTFVRRYLEHMSSDTLAALRLCRRGDKRALPLKQVIAYLEGLWSKEGFGAKFFQEDLAKPEVAEAIGKSVDIFFGMVERGTADLKTDLKGMLTNSDMLDAPIRPFAKKKSGVG